jgi:hypothetical protein
VGAKDSRSESYGIEKSLVFPAIEPGLSTRSDVTIVKHKFKIIFSYCFNLRYLINASMFLNDDDDNDNDDDDDDAMEVDMKLNNTKEFLNPQ